MMYLWLKVVTLVCHKLHFKNPRPLSLFNGWWARFIRPLFDNAVCVCEMFDLKNKRINGSTFCSKVIFQRFYNPPTSYKQPPWPTHTHAPHKTPLSVPPGQYVCVCELACCCSVALGPAVDWLSSDVSDAVRALISEMHSQLLIFIGNQMFGGRH